MDIIDESGGCMLMARDLDLNSLPGALYGSAMLPMHISGGRGMTTLDDVCFIPIEHVHLVHACYAAVWAIFLDINTPLVLPLGQYSSILLVWPTYAFEQISQGVWQTTSAHCCCAGGFNHDNSSTSLSAEW